MIERTLVIIKPEAVKRSLIGDIIQRLEKAGKVIGCRMTEATREQLEGHMPSSAEWLRKVGEKALGVCEDFKEKPADIYGSEDPLSIGAHLREKGIDIYLAGKIVVLALEGEDVIRKVRRSIGNTLPYKAELGTIRRDLCDNPFDIKYTRGAFDNLVHASADESEARNEISIWFPELHTVL